MRGQGGGGRVRAAVVSDLKTIVERLEYADDASVQAQLDAQTERVQKRLAQVRHKLLIMSGKGGVGKSTVTSQLALALARGGWRVGVLDVDLNGPSIAHMLGLSGETWSPSGAEVEPLVTSSGVKVASMAFFLDGVAPVRWVGPKHLSHVWLGMQETASLREFLGDVNWGPLDALLLDMPPGAAADKPPAILQYMPEASAVLVTTGSAVARTVVERSRRYAADLGLPVLGTILNLANLFESAPIDDELARIPFDPELARSLDSGSPLPREHTISRAFDRVATQLRAALG